MISKEKSNQDIQIASVLYLKVHDLVDEEKSMIGVEGDSTKCQQVGFAAMQCLQFFHKLIFLIHIAYEYAIQFLFFVSYINLGEKYLP
jgi:hypothetical protein